MQVQLQNTHFKFVYQGHPMTYIYEFDLDILKFSYSDGQGKALHILQKLLLLSINTVTLG